MCKTFKCTKCGQKSAKGSYVKLTNNFHTVWSEEKPYCNKCTLELLNTPPSNIHRIIAVDVDNATRVQCAIHPGAMH